MSIPERDIEVTFFRSRGPGGQHKNVTDSAVRIRHVPTGIVVVATASRSQHRNRTEALTELARRLAARRRRRKRRVGTRPTQASKERRIGEKKRRGMMKKMRKVGEEE